MISKEEVEKIAKLARLELTDIETEKMQKDLSAILDYFDLLKKAPLRQGSAGHAPKVRDGSLRKDDVLPRDSSVVERIITGAPDKKDGYIKVKTIL